MSSPFAAVCLSLVLPYTFQVGDAVERGTVAYRTPAHCSEGVLPEATAPAQAAPLPAYSYPPAKVTKARTGKPCKRPGRTRNARGICGRWG